MGYRIVCSAWCEKSRVFVENFHTLEEAKFCPYCHALTVFQAWGTYPPVGRRLETSCAILCDESIRHVLGGGSLAEVAGDRECRFCGRLLCLSDVFWIIRNVPWFEGVRAGRVKFSSAARDLGRTLMPEPEPQPQPNPLVAFIFWDMFFH